MKQTGVKKPRANKQKISTTDDLPAFVAAPMEVPQPANEIFEPLPVINPEVDLPAMTNHLDL